MGSSQLKFLSVSDRTSLFSGLETLEVKFGLVGRLSCGFIGNNSDKKGTYVKKVVKSCLDLLASAPDLLASA